MKKVIFPLLFLAVTAFAQPVINHVPLLDKFIWPDTVQAGVYSSGGVDSVWVRWYRNNTTTGIKQFKLINTSGYNYRAAFNLNINELYYGDSIFYKIFAQDASSSHKKDSTVLYKFRHVYSYLVCIGSGTDSVSYPFYTFFMDGRTDMLFSKSEITAAGGLAGGITKIGFYIRSASPQVMSSFTIKMQNTNITSLTGFVSSGWTQVYSGSYTVPASGWQFIQLQQMFIWNANSNLLVEICFHNTVYTLASKVCAANVPGRTWENHQDNAMGCLLSGGTLQALRPDFVMQMSPTTGVENSEVPVHNSLLQNYPNPFNPVTKIFYSIPPLKGIAELTDVKLTIFDIMGREALILVNKKQSPGNYEIEWDASEQPGGIYICKIQTGTFTKSIKMVLIK